MGWVREGWLKRFGWGGSGADYAVTVILNSPSTQVSCRMFRVLNIWKNQSLDLTPRNVAIEEARSNRVLLGHPAEL